MLEEGADDQHRVLGHPGRYAQDAKKDTGEIRI
jgi:hypothetical protein